MKIIKVNNLVQKGGKADYKNLDIGKIVLGTQFYPSNENVAYFYYEDEVTKHNDVEIISETDYQYAIMKNKESIESKDPLTKLEERLRLEQAQANTELFEMMLSLTSGGTV